MREIKLEIMLEIGAFDFAKKIVTHYTTVDRLINGKDTFDYSAVNIIAKRQFTGLKDKTGVDIYEGDITPYLDCYKEGKINASVVFDDSIGSFVARWIESGVVMYDDIDGCADWLIVIGNIYENPELLK